jgi:hypothetical protein
LEHLLQPLDRACPLLGLAAAQPGQVAQTPDLGRRHEARADEPELEQLAQPARVDHVALAPGHVVQVLGVDQPALEPPLEHREHGLPVDTGCLHPDQGDAEALQPVAQLLELGDRGAEGVCLLRAPTAALARARHAHGGNDAVAVHIKTRAALDGQIHQSTSSRDDGDAPSGGASRIRFCGSRSRQQSTIPQAPAPYSLTRS